MSFHDASLFGSMATPARIECIGWLLVHSLWQFTLVGLLVAVSNYFLRRASPSERYRMGLVGLFTITLLPVLTAALLNPQLYVSTHDSATAISSRDMTQTDEPPLSSVFGNPMEATSHMEGTDPIVAPGFAPQTTIRSFAPQSRITGSHADDVGLVDQSRVWLPLIVIVWITGVLFFSLRPMWGWYVVLRLRSVGSCQAGERLQHALARVARSMGIARPVRILESTCISSPIVTGCFRSVILVPTALATNLPIAQLEAIVAHELAHVRRYDFCVNLLQTLLETLFFYHPVVWWLSRRLRVEREHCCDDLVVKMLGDKVAYGRALLAIEEFRGSPTSLALGASDGRLLHRVKRLLTESSSDDRRGSLAWICLVPAIVGLTVMAWALPAPQLLADETDLPFRLPDHGYVKDLRWLEGDQQIITVSYQGGINVRRWLVDEHRLLSEIKLLSDKHGRTVEPESLRLSGDGRRVVGVTDAYVGVWDSTTGELLRQLPIPRQEWNYDTAGHFSVSWDGTIVVAGLETTFTRLTTFYPSFGIVWDTNSGAELCRFEDEAGAELIDIELTADAEHFVTLSRGHKIGLWETRTGRLIRDLSDSARDWTSPDPEVISNLMLTGIALSPDDSQLAIVSTFGIRIVDVREGQLRHSMDAPYRFGRADVLYSPDGTWLARHGAQPTETRPDSVLVWSLGDLQSVTEIICDADRVRFSEGGARLATIESDFHEALSVYPIGDVATLGPLPVIEHSQQDRVEENTHSRGNAAQRFADQWAPSWGEPQDGVQYGLAFTTESQTFVAGERVRMVAFVRNVGDEPIKIDFRPDMFGNVPRLANGDGRLFELQRDKLAGRVSMYREDLEPGEMFGPLYLGFGLGPEPNPDTQFWTPYWDRPESGVYRVTHEVSIAFHRPNSEPPKPVEDWTKIPLTSGSISFTIAPQVGQPQPIALGSQGVVSTDRSGRWLMGSQEIEFETQLIHGADTATDLIVRRREPDGAATRSTRIQCAWDAFGNRQLWRAAWEPDRAVLWMVSGFAPTRGAANEDDANEGEVRRFPLCASLTCVDLRNPHCIIERSFDGWPADWDIPEGIQNDLNSHFKIPEAGNETYCWLHALGPGMSPPRTVAGHIQIFVDGVNRYRVVDLEPGQPPETEAEGANLADVIRAVILKQQRFGIGLEARFRASLGTAPDVPIEAINTALAACREAGVSVPEFPEANDGEPVFRRPIETDSNDDGNR